MKVTFTAHTAKSPFEGNERTRVEREMEVFGAKLLQQMKMYPPVPAGRNYRRTKTLSRSWGKEGPKQIGSALVIEIFSSSEQAPYNKWVEGDQQTQACANIGWLKVSEAQKPLWDTARKNINKILSQK